MSDQNRLLVPVNLSALMLGANAGERSWADITPHYDWIASLYITLGDKLVAPPFQTGAPLKPGVHLHWSLPDALTHGQEGMAQAEAVISEGAVTAINVLDGGFGYTRAPEVELSGGDGNGAAAVATLDPNTGKVTAIDVLKGGSGYVTPPIVTVAGSGNIEYVDVPDRWMVMRYQVNTAGEKVNLRSWMVASNALTMPNFSGGNNPDSVTWPTLDNPNTPFMYLGRHYDYTQDPPTNIHGYLDGLKAVGPGDPGFAAYYPNCFSVFGFYDSLDDLPNGGELMYMVCGWYDNPAQNPLSGVDSMAAFDERMRGLAWCLRKNPGDFPSSVVCHAETSESADGEDYPTDILCHAMTYGLHWQGPEATYPANIPAGQPELAIGNTTAEAMSALIASKVPAELNQPGVETIMNAFQAGLLDRLDQPDGVLELEMAMHKKQFGNIEGGKWWVVEKKQTSEAAESEPDFDPQVSALLTDLLETQAELDRLTIDSDSYRWEMYSAWYKKILIQLSPYSKEDPVRAQALIDGLQELNSHIMAHRWQIAMPADPLTAKLAESQVTPAQIIELLNWMNTQIEHQQGLINDRQQRVNALIVDLETAIAATMPEYHLVLKTKPRYHGPNDPVVLLAGPGVARNYRHGFDYLEGEGERLPCRISGQTITGLTVTVPDYGDQTVTDTQLKPFYGAFPQGGAIPTDVQPLFVETMLLATTMSDLIALAAYGLAGVQNPTQPQLDSLAAEVRIIQTAPWNADLYPALRKRGLSAQRLAESGGLVGVVPAHIAAMPWTQPWDPVLMEWSLQFLASYQSPGEMGICNPVDKDCQQKWIFGEVDYAWNTEFSPEDNPAGLSQGATLITPNAPEDLAKRLAAYIADHPDSPYKEELEEVLVEISNLNMLSQVNSGVNQAMMMRLPALQLPVIDLFNQDVGDMVAGDIGENNQVSPLLERRYTPIRAGHFNYQKMWVVGSFGRIQPIVDNGLGYEPIIAKTMETPGEDYKKLAQLPPRLSQNARLDFQFLQAENDQKPTNSDPATTPICGWVIPNYFDRSMMIYDQLGVPQGSIQMLAGGMGPNGSGLRWTRVPGKTTPLGAFPDLDNVHLQNFVATLLNLGADGRDAVSEFLNVARLTLSTIVPTGGGAFNNAMSVLIGRPLAVVRASLNMALGGLPAYDQSWDALQKLVDTHQFETQGFTDVEFPIRLGDIRRGLDGMIGYFADDQYDTFYAGLIPDVTPLNQTYVKFHHLINLKAHPAEAPTKLTIIADPRAPFSMISDCLPMETIHVPPYHIQEALANMDVTFRVGPLLSDPDRMQLPVPAGTANHLDFFFHPDVVTWHSQDRLVDENLKAQLSEQPYHLREGWLRLHDFLEDNRTKKG